MKLKRAFVGNGARVSYAVTGDFFWHPLCSVVHNDCLVTVSCAIDNGKRKPGVVWQQLGDEKVVFASDTAFFNINSQNDLKIWREGFEVST